MNLNINSFFSGLLSKTILIVLATSTLATAGVATAKLMSAKTPVQSPDRQGVNILAVAPNPTSPVLAIIKKITPTLAAPLIPTPTSASTSSACVIVLFGQQYDVTKLQSTHSGGNVFYCGTDMTTLYTQRHGTNLDRMQPYLISSASSLTTTPAAHTIKPPINDDDDREDKKNKDRYIDSPYL